MTDRSSISLKFIRVRAKAFSRPVHTAEAKLLLRSGSFTSLTTDNFSFEHDTLSFVRLGLAEGANLGAYLTNQFFVYTLKANQWCRALFHSRCELQLRGDIEDYRVGVTDSKREQVTLILDAITYANYFHLSRIALTDTHHHIVDESTVQTMHSTMAFLVGRTLNEERFTLNFDRDIGVNLLGQCTLRSFHRNGVIRGHRNIHFCRERNW